MRRWEDNITIDLKQIGVVMRNWIDSSQDIECGIESPVSISHDVSYSVV